MGASLAPVPPDEQFTAQHLNQFVNDLAAEVTASCVYTCASFPFYSMARRSDLGGCPHGNNPSILASFLLIGCHPGTRSASTL
jgi:hypothetical protein